MPTPEWVGPYDGEEYCTEAMGAEDPGTWDYGDEITNSDGDLEIDMDDKIKRPRPPKVRPPSPPPAVKPPRPPSAPGRVGSPPRVRLPGN